MDFPALCTGQPRACWLKKDRKSPTPTPGGSAPLLLVAHSMPAGPHDKSSSADRSTSLGCNLEPNPADRSSGKSNRAAKLQAHCRYLQNAERIRKAFLLPCKREVTSCATPTRMRSKKRAELTGEDVAEKSSSVHLKQEAGLPPASLSISWRSDGSP